LVLQLLHCDENGNVAPHDHPDIHAEDGIIRRIPEHYIVEDAKIGGRRLSSMAFKASSGVNAGMSVDLQKQIEEAGLDTKTYVTNPPWLGAIRFQAGHLRDEGFQVGYDPTEDNPFHGEVWGNFSKGKQRKLQQICDWFVPIADVSLGSD
jgi:hypothetical protein